MSNNRIFKNASWIICCKIAQSALSFLITVLTARYFGPSNYGLINYAAAVVAFVAPVVQLGLSNIQVQEIIDEPNKEGEIIGTTLSISLISAVFCIIGVISFSAIANKSETDTIVVCALYSMILLFQSAELLQYWFQAKYLSKYSSITALIAFAIVTLYKIFLLATRKSIYFFAVSNAIDYVIITFALLAIYKKLGGKRLQFSVGRAKKMFAKSKYYIVANMMIAIFSQTDRIMLKSMINDTATGLYSAAISCASVAGFVYAAIIDSYRPTIFINYKSSKTSFENSMVQLYAIIIYLSALYCITVVVFAEPIIKIIYGNAFLDAVTPLRIAVWYSTFSYLGVARNVWILAERKQKYLWIINLSGALGNILINYILIPIIGVSGAAVASLLTQFFANVVISYIISDTRRSVILMFRALNPKIIYKLFKKI